MIETMLEGGYDSVMARLATTSTVATPMAEKTFDRPNRGTRLIEILPKIREPRPNPIIKTPDEKPTLSGNQTLVVAMMEL